MAKYLKPQTPLQHQSGDYIYPITTVDQVITAKGERLNANLISVDLNESVESDTNINLVNNKPKAGFIYPLASDVVPEGFLLCDGAEYLRAEYTELFAAIGTMYGSGDGSTTFNVPNLSTRVPVGKGDGYELGDIGGEDSHTLTTDEMPNHNHKYYYPGHDTGTDWYGQNGSAKGTQASTTSVGGSQPHNNMQPYTVVNYIIATGKNAGVNVTDIITGVQALPLDVEYGGTGATNITDIHKNLHIRANAVNLLDNSDFTNPVNQRGQTSYEGMAYGIDRWLSVSSHSVITINDGYINVKSDNGNDIYWKQCIEPNKIKNNEKYTIMCELKDGSIWSKCYEAGVDYNEGSFTLIQDGVSIGSMNFKYLTDNELYQVMFSTSSSIGIDIVNVALYEGEYTEETLPEYQPKGYGTELTECQRYYRQSWSGETLEASGAIISTKPTTSRYLCSVNFENPMRITPTVTIKHWAHGDGKCGDWAVSAAYGASAQYVSSTGFIVYTDNSAPADKTYAFHYTASADL